MQLRDAFFASRMHFRDRTEQADFFLPVAHPIEDSDPVGTGRPADVRNSAPSRDLCAMNLTSLSFRLPRASRGPYPGVWGFSLLHFLVSLF